MKRARKQTRRLSVQLVPDDAGLGFEPEALRPALDPSYTTRVERTGPCLALVATIAELHGGSTRIHPEPGLLSGARINAHFPFRDPRTRGPRSSSPTPALP